MRGTRSATGLGGMLMGLGWYVAVSQAIGVGPARGESPAAKPDPVAVGSEIFNREWIPNDPRSHGGDGLGPVYNDSSCVACHNAAGSGGAGPVSKNIEILSASLNGGMPVPAPAPGQGSNQGQPRAAQSGSAGAASSKLLDPLTDIHAGFRTSRTVVLHKFGTDPNYDSWRSRALSSPVAQNPGIAITQVFTRVSASLSNDGVITAAPAPALISSVPLNNTVEPAPVTIPSQPLTDDIAVVQKGNGRGADDSAAVRAAARIQQIRLAVLASSSASRQALAVGPFRITRSQRNPTPLFGLGLIDAIPDEAIVAMEKRQAKEAPQIKGRVSRLKDGRIGRLGWKGQTANVEDFVLNACAIELGLEVPGHHQAMTPQAPKYRTTGLDLTSEECAALVAYVRSLPKPVERRPSSAAEAKHLEAGKATFASIGCAGCHAPKVGDVVGIYSDLLLHDMGQELGDEGSYDDSSGDDSDEPLVPRLVAQAGDNRPAPTPAPRALRGATRREWRTPPLWGFRDSGPYLHDGRAQTLEEAVALHGGQGEAAAQKFFRLSPAERRQIEVFLKSLVAPSTSVQLARRGE